MTKLRVYYVSAAILFGASSMTMAHHSTGPIYDRSRTVQAEGEVTRIAWRNPHIAFTLAATDASGDAQVWEIVTNSVSIVSRFGLTADLVDPGTTVRVAGNPSRAAGNGMWLTNMLLPDGREILFGARYQARWSEQTIGEDIRGEITADPSGELGIFRVWTSGVGGGGFWNSSYPLTVAAAAARANHDLVRDDPTANCAPKGMPYIMEQPYPMQLIDQGDTIVLRLEEYDTVRSIELAPNTDASDQSPNRLGYSIGHWQGDTLVVNTSAIDYPFFNSSGIPQSSGSRIEERFSLNDDGSRLNYSMTVTDSATFTEAVTMSRFWTWRPGEEIRPYDCTP